MLVVCLSVLSIVFFLLRRFFDSIVELHRAVVWVCYTHHGGSPFFFLVYSVFFQRVQVCFRMTRPRWRAVQVDVFVALLCSLFDHTVTSAFFFPRFENCLQVQCVYTRAC